MLETLKRLRKELYPIYGQGEGQAMIRLVFSALKGWTATDIIVHEGDVLSDYMRDKISDILKRLKNGEPIQYVLGKARFYGMDFDVTPSVLIPRPETETLVDMIVNDSNGESDLNVLDIGTGSGCIAISLSRNLVFPNVMAIDISSEALSVAKGNAEMLHAKVDFRCCDIANYDVCEGSLDVVVSNPPYIHQSEAKDMERNVVDFEPHLALFVKDDSVPLQIYDYISDVAWRGLCVGGRLYLEINPLDAQGLKEKLEGRGFVNVEIRKDFYDRDRFVYAEKGEL
jgi:release factor glutamine methyltransferase